MSGIVNNVMGDFGVGTNSGQLGGVGQMFTGCISPFVDRTGPYFDCNLNGGGTFNSADEDTNGSAFCRTWESGTMSYDFKSGGYLILFGPGYTSVDAANGGWRMGMKFPVPVMIYGAKFAPVWTNARARWLGLYKQDDESGTNRTYVTTRHATSIQFGRATPSNLTIYGEATEFYELPDADHEVFYTFEPTVSQYWMWSFGDSINASGNNNAGAAALKVFGSIMTPPSQYHPTGDFTGY